MRDRGIAQGAVLTLFSAKFKPFVIRTDYQETGRPEPINPAVEGAGNSDADRANRVHTIGPFLSGKPRTRERRPSPIHSRTFSVVTEISTGWQPMPSISSILFFPSTIPRMWPAHVGSAGSPRKLTSVAHASSRRYRNRIVRPALPLVWSSWDTASR